VFWEGRNPSATNLGEFSFDLESLAISDFSQQTELFAQQLLDIK
jgi:hypothetical protein